MNTLGPWKRHLIYRKEVLRTTWKFRIMSVAGVVLIAVLTKGLWIPMVGRSLVCDQETVIADTIVLDNFDEDYLLFERAVALHEGRSHLRVLVPVAVGSEVAMGFVDVMARISRLHDWEVVPVREIEPISLNVAYQIRDFLKKEHVTAVSVVSPGFRSRRSLLIYAAVLGPADISTSCVPVLGDKTPETWTSTWHGVQEVALQLAKLEYYRYWVLPFQTSGEVSTVAQN